MNTKKELLIYAAAFVAMTAIAPLAFADNINQNQSGAGNTQIIGNGNNSPGSNSPHLNATGGTGIGVSNSSSSSKSSASQGQAQFAEGGDSKASADNKGNSLAVSQNYKRNPVSSANAAPIYPTANCSAASSLAVQGPGFGVGAATSHDSENCVTWNDSNGLATLGYKKAAVKRLCMDDKLRAALAAEKVNPCASQDDASPATVSSPAPDYARWPSTRNH